LLHRPEFRAAYELGMRRSSPHFTVFGLAAAPGSDADRFGITVSRKLGGAVVRNRLRRRTRELLRRLPGSPGPACDLVINPRPSVATADFGGLAEELAATVEKLRKALHTARAPRALH
jgi:ribonuclease P protein component